MPTEKPANRLASFSLGTTAIFDLTGAVIYRMLRAGLPPAPPETQRAAPLLRATRVISEAHREVASRARGKGNPASAA
jgi:hypothetical protein